MITIDWYPGIALRKSVEASDNYEHDLNNRLNQATITNVTITGEGVTAQFIGHQNGVVTYRVSGGIAGISGTVKLVATLNDGQVVERTTGFVVE